jgi:inhibitor of cysteine peptidase
MKLRIIAISSLLILIPLLFSCIVTSHDYYVEISCDEFTNNPQNMEDDFEIEIGDKIYVKLCSNPTTVFSWSYEMSGDTVLKEEDHDFEEPEGDAVGAAGNETWTFEATEQGEGVINMEYSQPWEGGIKGEWTYKISVVVE